MSTADAVIAAALQQLGKPYVWGAAGPNSFDCSGLVVYAFRKGAGLSLPHFTGSLWAKYPHISRASIAPGDLVFPNPSHVGIAISNTRMVVAPHTGSVVEIESIGTVWGAARVIPPGTGPGTIPIPSTTDVGLIPGAGEIHAIYEIFANFAKTFAFLTDPANIRRMLIFAAGAALIIYGLIRLTRVDSAAAAAVTKVVESAQ